MIGNRRWFARTVATGAVAWSIGGPSRAVARGFGFGNAIGNAAGAAVGQAIAEITVGVIQGLQMALLIIPLLLLESFLDGFADLLKLDDKQRKQLKSHREELLADVIRIGKDVARRPEGERAQAIYEELQRLAPKYRERLFKLLKPDQQRRLIEIERQLAGPHAMLSDELSARLELTDEQRADLTEATAALEKKIADLRSGRERVTLPMLLRMLVMRKLADGKVAKILTDQQQAKWLELTGEPISLREFIPWEALLDAIRETEQSAQEGKQQGR